jgi:hypothetical protein
MSGSSVASLLLPSGTGSSIGGQLERDRFLFLDHSSERRYACSFSPSVQGLIASLMDCWGGREEQNLQKAGVFHLVLYVSG